MIWHSSLLHFKLKKDSSPIVPWKNVVPTCVSNSWTVWGWPGVGTTTAHRYFGDPRWPSLSYAYTYSLSLSLSNRHVYRHTLSPLLRCPSCLSLSPCSSHFFLCPREFLIQTSITYDCVEWERDRKVSPFTLACRREHTPHIHTERIGNTPFGYTNGFVGNKKKRRFGKSL